MNATMKHETTIVKCSDFDEWKHGSLMLDIDAVANGGKAFMPTDEVDRSEESLFFNGVRRYITFNDFMDDCVDGQYLSMSCSHRVGEHIAISICDERN